MNLETARALFDGCIELPAAERPAWLQSRTEDPLLRERVLRLASAHDDAQARDALRPPAPLPAERTIGSYRLIERIGEGAMGEVYLAEQLAPVVRRVALKVIKPGMDSGEVIARFEQERQTLALMSHPSIAHIIDAGTTENGRPYFAMEYVAGIPLNRYCDQQRLSIDERLTLFLQICDAVQHAHQKGVIHRDLKPGNLLVTDLDGRPVPKVIDFGIAKAVSPGQQPSMAHTRFGYLIGTPEYMSPEQAQLSPLDIDTRSDVYSLGVILHELLTGTLPFAKTDLHSTPAQIVQELLTFDPAAPSTRFRSKAAPVSETSAARRRMTARQLAARLSGDLDWIVLNALEKDRNRRYGSPAEFAADIRRHLANEPVLAGPPSPLYRLSKFVSRHRLALALLAGLFVSALVFAVVMAYQAQQLAAQRDEANFQAQRAEASNEFMSLMLEEVGPNGEPLSLVELLGKGEELLDRQYSGDPRFRARMLLQMSRRYMDLANTEKQMQVLARAEAIAAELKDDELMALTQCAAVGSELDGNHPDRAKQRMATAREALSRLSRPPVAVQVDCLRAEAELDDQAGQRDSAVNRLSKAQKLLEDSGSTRGLQYNAVLTDLGGLYFRSGRFREALELNQQTRETLERNGRGGTLASITLSVNHASLLYRLGEVLRAQQVGRDALDRMRALREEQPTAPAASVSYAITLNRLDQADESIKLLNAAVDHALSIGNQFWGANANYQLGRALLVAGNLTEGDARLHEAQRVWLTNPGPNRERLAELSRSLAELALVRGDVTTARQHIDASLAGYSYPERNSPPGLPSALVTASRIYLQSGQADKAEKLASDSLGIAERVARDVQQSADVGEALLALAQVRNERGDTASARIAAQRAAPALANSLGAAHRLTRQADELQRKLQKS